MKEGNINLAGDSVALSSDCTGLSGAELFALWHVTHFTSGGKRVKVIPMTILYEYHLGLISNTYT